MYSYIWGSLYMLLTLNHNVMVMLLFLNVTLFMFITLFFNVMSQIYVLHIRLHNIWIFTKPRLHKNAAELGTFEWWTSGLMLDPLFFLISRLNNAYISLIQEGIKPL